MAAIPWRLSRAYSTRSVKSRKYLISRLEELDDPSFKEEILTNKRRIIEVSPILN
jgi:hypothetical protein